MTFVSLADACRHLGIDPKTLRRWSACISAVWLASQRSRLPLFPPNSHHCPQTKASKQSAKQAPPAPHAPRVTSAATTPPRKPVHVIPRVEYGREGRYVVICPKHGLLSLEPDTKEWFAWLAKQSSFRFVGQHGTLTAHHEWRIPKGAWRAHRHLRNHSYTLRLAPTQELTMAVLEQAAEALQAHLM